MSKKGVIRSECKGFWFVEDYESRRSYFVHHSQVISEIYLHVGDIIEFVVMPNPVRPTQMMAGSVKFIGREIDSAARR